MKVAAIIPAAGKGKRLGAKTPKAFLKILGKPLLIHTLERLLKSYPFQEVLVAADPSKINELKSLLKRYRLAGVRVVAGGKTRPESVRNAVLALGGTSDWVLIHDAARPFVGTRLTHDILAASKKTGAAICALEATATVKKADRVSMLIRETLDRRTIYLAQTPQVFKKSLLTSRYKTLGDKALSATDEAALFDGTKVKVKIVPGNERNLKVTTPGDLDLFKFYFGKKG